MIGFEVTDYLFKIEMAWILGVMSIMISAGYEEFGWRGLMQKDLQKSRSPFNYCSDNCIFLECLAFANAL